MVENFDGYRLTQGRHLLGVRREELAVRCFVTPRRVLAWENEHAEPTEEELAAHLEYLKLINKKSKENCLWDRRTKEETLQ